MTRHQIRWTAEDDALLGTMSDQDLATILGTSRNAVATRRIRAGIAAYDGAPLTYRLLREIEGLRTDLADARQEIARVLRELGDLRRNLGGLHDLHAEAAPRWRAALESALADGPGTTPEVGRRLRQAGRGATEKTVLKWLRRGVAEGWLRQGDRGRWELG